MENNVENLFTELTKNNAKSGLLQNSRNNQINNCLVAYEDLEQKYRDIIVESSVKQAEEFMRIIDVPEMIIYGGALYKNCLRSDLSIDDYDVALFGPEENKQKVVEVIENLKSKGWDVSEGKLDYLNENYYYYMVDPNGVKYDFGYKKKVVTTLTLENLVIKLEKDAKGNIKRYVEDIKVLDDFINGKIEVNNSRTPNKYELIQRVLLTSAKYSDKIKLTNNQDIIDFSNTRANEPDEIDENGINITSKKREVCLDKLYGLLAKIKMENKENFVLDILKTNAISSYFPELNEVLANPESRKKILSFNNKKLLREYTESLIKSNQQEKSATRY